jgi:uncharacterized protein
MQREWRAASIELAEDRARSEALNRWQQVGQSVLFEHRWEHIQQVAGLALWLAAETGADRETVEAAAWLHDVCKAQPNHGAAGAAEAERLLPTTDFPAHKIAAVADAIHKHVGLYRDGNPVAPLEAAVLWDADKLSKLGVQALIYSLSTAHVAGMSLAQRRKYADEFTRTVLIRTVASMHTAPARAEAQRRYAAMLAALDAWADEEKHLYADA